MASIKQLSIGLIKRNAIKRGPTSSDAWNDSFEEVVNDLNTITSNWNNTLHPLLSGLPAGGVNDLDAFTNGLDGRTMYVDSSATSTVINTTYFNTLEDRPRSIKEQFDNVYDRLITIKEELETEIINASGGLTSDQKTKIGANIFDGALTSSSTSLDGKSELNRLNITQLGLDLYGDDFVLNNDGTALLLYSIKQQLGALLTLHNGTWNSDITVDHAGVGGAGDFLANGSVPMTGSFRAVSGSAASPGITFTSDTGNNTGFYLIGEDQIGISIGGSNRLTINASNELIPADGTLNINGVLSVSSLISTATVLRQSQGYYVNTDQTSIAHNFDTLVPWSTPGQKLVAVKNNGVEQFAIDKDGNTSIDGDLTVSGAMSITSSTLVTNLNADFVDGKDGNTLVVGPSSATDTAIARFDLSTGKLIQDSLSTLDDDGSITISGLATGVVTVSGNYTVTTANSTVFCDSSGGPFLITLPSAGVRTMVVTFKKKNTEPDVTVSGISSQTIDGSSTRTLDTANAFMTIQSDLSGWWIISASGIM